MVYRHEFHGAQHDGLVLPNMMFHRVVYLPMDRQILKPAEYDAWTPTEGKEIGVYVYRRTSRREDGNQYVHLYLERVDTLVPKYPTPRDYPGGTAKGPNP